MLLLTPLSQLPFQSTAGGGEDVVGLDGKPLLHIRHTRGAIRQHLPVPRQHELLDQLPFANGVYDLRAGEFRPARVDEYVLYTCG